MMRTLCKALIVPAVFAFAMTWAPASSTAQELDAGGCDEENAGKDDAGSFRKVEKNGEVVYEFTGTIRVCGKVPKPNVVVILLEKSVGYEWDKLKQDFLPKIHDSLKGAPF